VSDIVLDRVQRALRGVVAGGERNRVIHETLEGVVDAARAAGGVLVALVDGQPSLAGRTGSDIDAATDAAKAALLSGRLTRRRYGGDPLLAVGQPVRAGNRIVGAIAVVGAGRTLDPTPLPVFADLATLALACRPSGGEIATPTPSPADVLASVATVAAQLDRPAVLVRTLAAAEELFGATAGCCVLTDLESRADPARRTRAVVAHQVGLERERLRLLSTDPVFVDLFTANEPRLVPVGHPLIATGLGRPGEAGVVLPLSADGRCLGHLLLLVPTPPDSSNRALMTSFASHIALALRGAAVLKRLVEHDERLVGVVHSLADPVIVVDPHNRFVTVNGAAGELFGLAGPFEVGQPAFGRLGHPDLEDLLTTDQDATADVPIGSPARLYRAVTRRIVSSERRLLGRVLVLQDVSKEREMERVKSDFVAVIGHELRTPLTVVQGYATTLRRRWDQMNDEVRASAFEGLEQNADRLERLIEDLLFISGISDSNPPLELGPEDLGPMIDQCSGGRIVVRRPNQPLVLPLDREKFEQVLRHLLDNALKYSTGSVLVEASPAGEMVEVSVTDTGPGIFSGDIPHLFERFHQLDGSATRHYGGTGIGLYICRRLVEMMGGRIWCESRLGVGSRFVFTLPVAPVVASRQRAGLPGSVAAAPTWADGTAVAPADRVRASGRSGARA
jgi:signal transduction histidine kinase